jgi:hypothetical protein
VRPPTKVQILVCTQFVELKKNLLASSLKYSGDDIDLGARYPSHGLVWAPAHSQRCLAQVSTLSNKVMSGFEGGGGSQTEKVELLYQKKVVGAVY